ncbi:hypothetical protein NHX12_030391 [Muraenolepis orangiensis]|uniref:Uncharacterized protein n=1 Tax=Muraenolepis orangiensis TaxID=630683 RepID=A0A9Q0EDV4_9TELE|nr:hypothetical protein NHX12_030391 [Muraenolepis orangiensis]
MTPPSGAPKRVILLELTVPWEERIKEANERGKRGNYTEPVGQHHSNGRRARPEPNEVGCRGFAGLSPFVGPTTCWASQEQAKGHKVAMNE